jgi:hypothetical protein
MLHGKATAHSELIIFSQNSNTMVTYEASLTLRRFIPLQKHCSSFVQGMFVLGLAGDRIESSNASICGMHNFVIAASKSMILSQSPLY